jgi:hypothetical protein
MYLPRSIEIPLADRMKLKWQAIRVELEVFVNMKLI